MCSSSSKMCKGIEYVDSWSSILYKITIIFEAAKYTYQVCVEVNNNPHIQIRHSSNQDRCSTCNRICITLCCIHRVIYHSVVYDSAIIFHTS